MGCKIFRIMKKLFFLGLLLSMTTSCCLPFGLVSTATQKKVSTHELFADLDVSSTKIIYFYTPSKGARMVGEENVVKCAVYEALLANGNADVFVGLEKQVKYNASNEVESITITGYPAKYINIRNANDDDIAIKLREKELLDSEKNTPIVVKLTSKDRK